MTRSDKKNGKSNAAGRPNTPTPKKTKSPHALEGGSREANRLAVAILEVLGGVRSPAEAAAAIGISAGRYYQLETRAIEGLVAACQPRPKGKQRSPETRLASLERELESARRECARQQALVRAAQRSLGLKAPPDKRTSSANVSGRRKRQPTVRALKAAETLREDTRNEPEQTVQRTEDTKSSGAAARAHGEAAGAGGGRDGRT